MSFINRTFNKRVIFVLVADGKLVRGYSDQPEGEEDRAKLMLVRPQSKVALVPIEMHDHQAIDSRNQFNKLMTGEGRL